MLMHHCTTTNVLYFLFFTVCINVPDDSMMATIFLYIHLEYRNDQYCTFTIKHKILLRNLLSCPELHYFHITLHYNIRYNINSNN